MIVVENVLPDARELRPAPSAWKSVSRLAWVQTLALLAVFLVSFLVAAAFASEEAAGWVGVTMVAVLLVLIIAGRVVTAISARISADAAKASGSARWNFDQEGVRVETPLSSTVFRWEMVAKVSEEQDRFLFALTPSSSAILPTRSLVAGQAEELRGLVAEVTTSGRLGRGVD
ncbi:YcxB family protein [Brevundimonas sp. GCM10030266]|uniref:YcxB family protein n=1 Tax=Brevundimonas sp. GCM10030266 TaxID=3273386 RepID=UPI003608D69A